MLLLLVYVRTKQGIKKIIEQTILKIHEYEYNGKKIFWTEIIGVQNNVKQNQCWELVFVSCELIKAALAREDWKNRIGNLL